MGHIADRDYEIGPFGQSGDRPRAGVPKLEADPGRGSERLRVDPLGGLGAGAHGRHVAPIVPDGRRQLGSSRVRPADEQDPSGEQVHGGLCDRCHRIRDQADVAAASITIRGQSLHDPDLLEDPNVMREEIGPDRDRSGELGRGSIRDRELLHDLQATGVGERSMDHGTSLE